MVTEEDMNEFIGKKPSASIFLSVFMQNSSHSFSSLLLDKHNWNDTVSKESYIKVSDILKNFHMEHYRNNRFEFFWMGNEN